MSATTRVSFGEYMKIQETEEIIRYELDQGELLVTPSPTPRHNEISHRIHQALRAFSLAHKLGYVTGETDFLLGPDTVRKPDAAFITTAHYQRIDLDRSPIEGAPALAVEVISPSNLAHDTFKKVHQYLESGGEVVWVVYPLLRAIEIHDDTGTREVRRGFLQAPKLLPGFKLSLEEIFEDDLRK